MPPSFRADLVLHIEDEPDWRRRVSLTLTDSAKITEAYGGKLKVVEYRGLGELPESKLEEEMAKLDKKIGQGTALVGVANAQFARRFLNEYLPGVIISDTSFPLNGKKVVEWIRSHGFEDYALIGLSGTPVFSLDEEVKNWFAQGNARYFMKSEFSRAKLENQVLRNKTDNTRMYGAKP